MKPTVKPWQDLVETDFIEHPAWMSWYEPEDMEALVSLGFDEQETREVLAAIDWSEDYALPLPETGASMGFMRLCVSARIRTNGGSMLVGYRTSASVAVFHKGKLYHFNKAVPDLSRQQAQELAAEFKEQDIFPLQVELPALHKKLEFQLVAPRG